jgi:hypothetical protein
MRASNSQRPSARGGNDGAALAAAAICGLVFALLALVTAVEAIAPIVHQQLTAAATAVS